MSQNEKGQCNCGMCKDIFKENCVLYHYTGVALPNPNCNYLNSKRIKPDDNLPTT